MAESAPGKIITFYSYKGGTGRTMNLANIAWILASNGKRVLAIDWDLEAPGLHRYFYPYLTDKALTSSDGVMEFVVAFAIEAVTPDPESQPSPDDWYLPYANILRYAKSLNWKFPGRGTLDFIPAGRQDQTYARRVNTFDWEAFYNRLGGGLLIEEAKQIMRKEYDYVLIDSRTGVSDTSGICTVQMPDVLALCFVLNNQSIDGADGVARSVYNQRRKENGDPGIRILPIPMRVDLYEKKLLEKQKALAKEKFAPYLEHLPESEREDYWGQVEVFYFPYYSYEEILAADSDQPGERNTLLAVCERIASQLTKGDVTQFVPSLEEQQSRAAEQVYNQLTEADQEVARRIFTRLVRLARPEEGVKDTLSRASMNDLGPSAPLVVKAFADAGVLNVDADGSPDEKGVQISDEALIQGWNRLQAWIGHDYDFLIGRQALRIAQSEWERSKRDDGALLRGAQLNEAQIWLAEHPADLGPGEKAYIEASQDLFDRELKAGRRTQRITRIAIASGLVAAVLVVIAVLVYRSADRIRFARSLADQAESLRTKEPAQFQQSMLLAIESIRRADSPAAQQTLASGLPLLPRPILSLNQNGDIHSVDFSPKGSYLAVAVRPQPPDGPPDKSNQKKQFFTVTVWDVSTNQSVSRLEVEPWLIRVVFSQNEQYLTLISTQGAVVVELSAGKEVSRIPLTLGPADGVHYTGVSQDDRFLIAVANGPAQVFNLFNGSQITIDAEARAFWQDGRSYGFSSGYVAGEFENGAIEVRQMPSFRVVQRLRREGAVGGLHFSNDGKLLAVSPSEGAIQIWDVPSGRIVSTLQRPASKGSPLGLVFVLDGKYAVVANLVANYLSFRIWDVAKALEIRQMDLKEIGRFVGNSPDGQYFVTVMDEADDSRPSEPTLSKESSLRVWELITGREVARLTLAGSIIQTSFSADNKQLAITTRDGAVRIYDLSSEPGADLVKTACERLSRNLTPDEWSKYMRDEPYRKTCPDLP